MTSVKRFKQKKQRSNIYKTRNTYETHQQTTTTGLQVPDLGQVKINAGLNV